MTMTETPLRERVEASNAAVEAVAQQIEALGDRATAEDHARLMEATEQLAGDLNELKDSEKVRGVQGEARALLDQLSGVEPTPIQGNHDSLASATGIVNPGGMTVGEAFVRSEAYAEFLDRNVGSDGEVKGIGGQTKSVDFAVSLATKHQNLRFDDPNGKGARNIVTGVSDTSGGALVEPQHLPGIVDAAEFRELTFWDLCTKIPLTSDTFDWVEIDSKTNNAAPVAEAVDAGDLTSRNPTGGATVSDVDGGLKPQSELSMVKRQATVENIAHLEYVTRRAAADAGQMVTIIQTFLREGLALTVEDQLLLGDGTSPNLRGLINATAPYALNTFDMSNEGVTSRIDAVARAVSLVRTTGRVRPTAMLVNADDWYNTDFLLAKDGNGNYQIGDPRATLDQLMSIWGLRVVVTEAIAAGTQLVGDFSQALIGDRQQAQLYMTDSNRDLFERNILTLLAEQRLGFGVRKPKAFCTIVA